MSGADLSDRIERLDIWTT